MNLVLRMQREVHRVEVNTLDTILTLNGNAPYAISDHMEIFSLLTLHRVSGLVTTVSYKGRTMSWSNFSNRVSEKLLNEYESQAARSFALEGRHDMVVYCSFSSSVGRGKAFDIENLMNVVFNIDTEV